MTTKQINPDEAKVLVSLRMPVSYRNQLAKQAYDEHLSFNQFLMYAIEKEHPPRVADSGD